MVRTVGVQLDKNVDRPYSPVWRRTRYAIVRKNVLCREGMVSEKVVTGTIRRHVPLEPSPFTNPTGKVAGLITR